MRHKVKRGKLNRTSSHRGAMLSNILSSLVKHEQIRTTLVKAKFLRPYMEKLVTRAKKNTLSNVRYLLSKLKDREVVSKLINVLGVRYLHRPGGYLRIVKHYYRYGDNAPMAYVEFVDRKDTAHSKKSKSVKNNKKIVKKDD